MEKEENKGKVLFKVSQISEEQAASIMDAIYKKSLSGIPNVSKSVDVLVADYLKKNGSPEAAAKDLINWQIAKCGTSGFITGLGGITLPVAIPANISSVLYVQMRMIAAIAQLGGFDTNSDQVQTLCYACLTGSGAADIIKQTGIKIGQKVTKNVIDKIPGKVLTTINQKVGFRLLTKFGEHGAINLVQVVPVAGGVVSGVIDVASTKAWQVPPTICLFLRR